MLQAAKKYPQVAPAMGTIHSKKKFHSADSNPRPRAHHCHPPGKVKRVADHFTKRPTKNKDFGKIYFQQTHISFLGIILFILFDPQTPLPSLRALLAYGSARLGTGPWHIG